MLEEVCFSPAIKPGLWRWSNAGKLSCLVYNKLKKESNSEKLAQQSFYLLKRRNTQFRLQKFSRRNVNLLDITSCNSQSWVNLTQALCSFCYRFSRLQSMTGSDFMQHWSQLRPGCLPASYSLRSRRGSMKIAFYRSLWDTSYPGLSPLENQPELLHLTTQRSGDTGAGKNKVVKPVIECSSF